MILIRRKPESKQSDELLKPVIRYILPVDPERNGLCAAVSVDAPEDYLGGAGFNIVDIAVHLITSPQDVFMFQAHLTV